VKVRCHVSLDLRGEEWPSELPCCPRVGDNIQSATRWGDFQLELEVTSITWKKIKLWEYHGAEEIWIPYIELGMTLWQRGLMCRRSDQGCRCRPGSVTAFYEWYAPLVGRTVGSFI